MKNNTVEVPKEWFERLIQIAEEAQATKPAVTDVHGYNKFLHGTFPTLMGYIESAKWIIK